MQNSHRVKQGNATLLGKLVFRKYPELASQLLSDYQVANSYSGNINDIPKLLDHFCALRGTPPEYILGPTKDTNKGMERRLFIALVIHLYQPHFFHVKTNEIQVQAGLLIQLANTLRLNSPRISYLIRDVVTMEKVYEDFRTTAHSIVEQIKGGNNASA